MNAERNVWPRLAGLDLQPTIGALHLWSQIAGKVRLMLTPWLNHGWHVPLYVSARGLTTGLIPTGRAAFSIDFDLITDVLLVRDSDGREGRVPLRPQGVSAFYAATMAVLAEFDIRVELRSFPCEIPDALDFAEDVAERPYDADVARAYWRALIQVQRVFLLFRSRFIGKCSPVHLFWGSFDLAVTRFSGREAPRHPGGAAHMPDAVAREAYSQEVSSAGFWPGDGVVQGPCFYSYAYPMPRGFANAAAEPAAAHFDPALGEFLLSYDAVVGSADPDAALMAFLQSTYEAAADRALWDRARLEGPIGPLGRPPAGV